MSSLQVSDMQSGTHTLVCIGNIRATRTCQRTASLPSPPPSFNQPKLLQPEYHMPGDTEKKRTNPTNQLFRVVMPHISTDGVTHRATPFFSFISPKKFYCKMQQNPVFLFQNTLTTECFSLAFLWCHICSAFTLQCFKFKQKGWSCLHSVSYLLITLQPWRQKKSESS